MDHIIAKYLSGEASDSEKKELRSWLNESEEHRKQFSQIQNLWHVAHPAFDPNSIDVEGAKKVFKEQIRSGRVLRFKSFLSTVQRVAAILFLPLLFLYAYQLFFRPGSNLEMAYQEITSPYGGRSEVKLPDGTRVWLNGGGKLKYPLRFDSNERRVKLLGEAYFEVKSSEKHPFVVETEELNVRATGTAFNVAAFEKDTIVSVTLIHGKVTVTDQQNCPTLMMPNENYTFNKSSRKGVLRQVDVYKWKAWKDGILVFRNERLDEVLKRLSQIYNVDIVLKDKSQASLEFRATFENESLDEILTMIMKTTSLSYTRTERLGQTASNRSKERIVIMNNK